LKNIRTISFSACLFFVCPGAGRADENPSLNIRGMIDVRLASTSDTPSWEKSGFGKTRYGDISKNEIVRLGDAAAVLHSNLAWNWSTVAHLNFAPEQRSALDVIEAFIQYKPAPTGTYGFKVKAGAFFPPISLENTNLAWTSPFTISSSAINSWVGEELRTIGIEATFIHRTDVAEASVSAAVFGYNDPTGSLLTWRGWAIHDREAGLFERLPLADLPNFKLGTGSAPGQQAGVDPFKELDHRLGAYVAAQLSHDDGHKLRAIYYNNFADNRIFDGRQYAWHTRFAAVGAQTVLGDDIDVVAQGMLGRTTMASFPTFTVADNDFASAFLLVSKTWGRHRLSGRTEMFDVNDNDNTPDDPNAEQGTALTLAYVFRPDDQQRLTFEVLHIDADREVRTTFGQRRRAKETQLQVSYRLFFSRE
jgi:hypothetical protein